MKRSTVRKWTSLWATAQGVLTAVAPGLSAKLTTKMVAWNFENADELEPRPSYLRQVRALGVGMAAAGIAGFAMERVSDAGEGTPERRLGDGERAD